MTALQFVAAVGPTVAVGITLVLAVGCACALSARAPAPRRWLGVLAAAGAAVYLACALLPLPRWTPLANGARPVASPAPARVEGPAPAERLAVAPREVSSGRVPTALGIAGEASGDVADRTEVAAGVEGTWRTRLALAFVLGAGLTLLHRLLGLARLWWILRTSRPAPDRLVALAPPYVQVRIARSAVRPFCCGQVRGAIVLPPALASAERHDVAAAVLAHEAAHLRAGDQRVQALFAWLGVALFWHPLFRWLARDVRLQCELLADAAAAGVDAPRYARAMLDLASGLPARRAALPATVPVFGRPSEFYRRLHMLLHRQDPLSPRLDRRARWLPALAFPLLAAGSAVVFGVAPTRAQEPVTRDPVPQQPAPSPAPQAGTASAAEAERVAAELHSTIEELRKVIESLHNEQVQNEQLLGRLVNDPTLAADVERTLRQVEVARRRPASAHPGELASPEDRKIQRQLEETVLEHRFARATVQDWAAYYGTLTGVTFVIAPDVAAMDAATTTLNEFALSRRSVADALRAIQTQTGVAYRIRDGVVQLVGPESRQVAGSPDVHVVSTRVARGDTLHSILQRANGGRKPDAELLQRTMDLNPQLDPRRLRIGEVVTMHIPRQHPQDPRAGSAPSVRGGGGSVPADPAATSPPAPRTGTDDGLFEVHALVSRCIELRGEVDMAKVRVEAADSDVDRRLAEIRLRTLEQQLDLAEQIVHGEREWLERRLQVLRRRQELGLIPAGEPQRIESFVKVLFDVF